MDKNFWKNINKPIIALSPMDGYTDSAFRRVCKDINNEIILFTEFASADGLHRYAPGPLVQAHHLHDGKARRKVRPGPRGVSARSLSGGWS